MEAPQANAQPPSRQQRFLAQAAAHIGAINAERATYAEWDEYREIYGGLCHKLPILIMTNGLCQTVAFIESKAAGDGPRARAYQRLREHLAATIGADQLLAHVQRAATGDYVRATRTILAAWIYYKRFAESILEVASGDDRGA